MTAMLVGSYIYGALSDKFGRRVASLTSLLNVAVGLLLTAFMPEYISFTVSRFISGLGKTSSFYKFKALKLYNFMRFNRYIFHYEALLTHHFYLFGNIILKVNQAYDFV